MSGVIAAPELINAAATELTRIGSAITAATTAATGPTTGLAAAAADEVSTATANLFRGYADGYQGLLATAAELHAEFVQTLTAASAAYAAAEAANAATVANALGGLSGSTNIPAVTPFTPVLAGEITALIMGGAGNPNPLPSYVAGVHSLYIQHLYPTASPLGLYTPEEFWSGTPLGGGSMTFGQSVSQGLALLHAGIQEQLANGNSAVVFGYSESATIATAEMNALLALPTGLQPDPSQLAFVLLGDANAPNSGLLSRFPGLYVPILDIPFNGATPANSPYQTSIYTIQYDGIAHAPRYPTNPLSDLNAAMGFFLGVHGQYPTLTLAQIASAQPLPTSPDYTGSTHYYMILNQDLPLLLPIRGIPVVGPAMADLIQPDLRVLVDMGNGNPGVEYADIATPASLFNPINPVAVGVNLAKGAVQGPIAALVDLGVLPESALPNSYPYLPSLDPGLSFNTGQSSVTGLSQLTIAIGAAERSLGLIPPWDSYS